MALPVARHLADGRVLGRTEVRKAHNANSACVQGKWQSGNRPSRATRRSSGNWWEIFKDPQLNALEEKVNVSNQSLRAAVDRFQEARDVAPAIAVVSFPSRHGERNTLAKPPIPAQGSVRQGLPPSIIRIWSSTEMFPTRRTFGEASGIPCNPAASWRRLRPRTWKRFA